MSYEQWEDGDASEHPLGVRHYLACCDCGLVHEYRLDPSPRPGHVRMTMARMPRSTAAVRRGREMRDKIVALARRMLR